MQIKTGFILHSMGDEYVVVAVEERTEEFRGMIRLNETGAFLWEKMQSDCTEASLEAALVERYGVTQTLAHQAVTSFMGQIANADVIEQ